MTHIAFKHTAFAILALSMITLTTGCGKETGPMITSSQDELTRYLDEHPELKDAPEDVINTNGI
jgi:hypothetical protein